ncbi:MAG: NAD(P)/FAD-dependent oxidoreductase [Sulfuritalea sp.]|nr:NAD(P)/FAD-dependent oxidoreductase [Sulfuritalea sp.]
MKTNGRRYFLGASLALGATWIARPSLAALLPPSRGRRVVIVGGGWGGLTAARHLRAMAPELEVVLIERNGEFRSLPLSNKWLVGLGQESGRGHDYASIARAHGYMRVTADVNTIDRESRRVLTAKGSIDYDWLILAVGIRYDYKPWFGDDHKAEMQSRRDYPAGFVSGELDVLKRKLTNFKGGDFVLTIPPSPYRCPPVPYERAVMIAWWFRQKGVKGKVVIVDPGPGMQAFNRVFADRYGNGIVHLTHASVIAVDPFKKTITTEFDELHFDDGMLMPAQQAGDLVWQAGLIERDGKGKATGWAAVDPVRHHAIDDDRVFLIGDLIGKVSTLFGHYPKSGHLANRLGRIVAAEIAGRSRGKQPEPQLPESVCHVYTDVDPMERVRIDANYRFRGDGAISQSVSQTSDPQPRGEDVVWAKSMYADFLAPD